MVTPKTKLRNLIPWLRSFEYWWTHTRKEDMAPFTAKSTAGYYYAHGYEAGRKAERRKKTK